MDAHAKTRHPAFKLAPCTTKSYGASPVAALCRQVKWASATLAPTAFPELMAAAGYHQAVFAAMPDDLPQRTQTWPEALWLAWRHALQQCWQAAQVADAELAHKFAHFGWALELWGLVRDAQYVLRTASRDPADCWLWLARCDAATGRLQEAMAYLSRVLASAPLHADARRLQAHIGPRLRQQQALAAQVRNGPVLRLESLNETHAAALAWQYRDPYIAHATDLPELADETAVHTWLAEQAAEVGRHNYAVMHLQYGFIGVVSLAAVGAQAFIHYWLGVDYQGQGHALPATTLLTTQARAMGMQTLFTSVLPDNRRSVRVLDKLGFGALAVPPLRDADAALQFSCLHLDGAAVEPDADLAALMTLCAQLDAPLLLAELTGANPPLAQSEATTCH